MFSVGTATGDSHVRGTRQTDGQMSKEHDRGVSSTHCCYEMGYESGGQAGAAGLAGADLCHTRTNVLNWRCGYRSAVVRVEWYQRRTKDVQMRIRTSWGRSGGGDEGRGLVSLLPIWGKTARGSQSVVGGVERGTGKMKCIPMCAVYGHREAGLGGERAAASTGGKEGG